MAHDNVETIRAFVGSDRMASAWRRIWLSVVGAVGLVLVATGCNDEGTACGDRTVRVGDRCLPLKHGRPKDSKVTTLLAVQEIIDADPGPGQLTTECAFKGVASHRYDVYRCNSVYSGRRIVLRLIHDRRRQAYGYELLSRPIPGIFTSKRGVCNPHIAQYCT
jgi:hypothetical protein